MFVCNQPEVLMLMISTGELAASYAAVLDVSPPQSKFHHLDFWGQQ